jgi:hypothetical protein
MKLNSQLTQYLRMKSKKKIKKRLNLSNLRIKQPAKPVNKFMNFIKFNNMTFLLNYFFNYMRKK